MRKPTDWVFLWGIAWACVALIVILAVAAEIHAGSMQSAGHAAIRSSVIQPGVTASMSGSEGANFAAYVTYWQNSSRSNASNPHSYPVNMSLSPAASGISATISVSSGTNLAVVKVYQGAAVFLNATIYGQVTVTATAGTTPLSIKVENLFTQAGSQVGDGAYHLWVNVSESASLTASMALIWNQHPDSFNVSYGLSSPYGYWINSSTVFVPFPSGVPVNYTSVGVGNATTVQTAYAGVYATNASLQWTGTLNLTVSFVPLPITTGPAVLIPLTQPRLVPGTPSTYTAFANWTNGGALPYAGLYVLQVPSSFGYVVNPNSVQVRTGSTVFVSNPPYYYYQFQGRNLPSGSYATQGSNVVIVPNGLTVGVTVKEGFQVNLSSLLAPPSQSLTAGAVLITFPNGSAMTWGELIEIFMAVPVLYAVAAKRIYRESSSRKLAVTVRDLAWVEGGLLAILVLSVLF